MSTELPVPPNGPVSLSRQASHMLDKVNGATATGADAMLQIQEKYAAERAKRLRSDGMAQYIDLQQTCDPKYADFAADPWLDARSETQTLRDGDSVKWLILGAGFGGILGGARLVMSAGADPDDIHLVDAAGGFGGT